MKVLPHPGTVHLKFAPVFFRLSLASAVAVVVTLGLLTATLEAEELILRVSLLLKEGPMSDTLPSELIC